MDLEENAVCMKIYLGESDHYDSLPAYKAVVHFLREKGIWGATVIRGIYGFGKQSKFHSSIPLRLSEDMPILIEVVDSRDKLMGLIPELSQMVTEGLITMEDVKVVRHMD
jgi:PII-like signaling protein